MKKLISLLGSLSLITTSTVTVLACGGSDKDNNNKTDKSTEILKLIEQFKTDLELITADYWKQRNSNFFDVTTNPESLYSFLNQKQIIGLVDANQGQAVKGDVLNDNQKKYLVSDINKILEIDKMKKYFADNINQEKYALIIEGIEFFNELEPDWLSLEINYTNDNISEPISESDFISYVSLNLNLNFTYLDSNNQQAKYSVLKKFVFTLTSDEILISSIQELEKDITNEYYLSGGEYSWLDKNNFNYTSNQDLANIFKPTDNEFRNIYENNNAFKENIIEFMQKNYFTNIDNIPLIFKGDIIYDSFMTTDYMSSETTVEYNWKNEIDLKIYNSIFNDLIQDQKAFLFDNEEEINLQLYKYLSNEYLKFYDLYNTRNLENLVKLEAEANLKLVEDKKIAFANSVRTGIVKLKGLSIEVNNSYIHPINDLSIFVSIAVSNNETKEAREDNNQSYLFGAMYCNLELGIQTFQDVFDIQPRENSEAVRPIVRFSGQGISTSGSLDNLWNGIQSSNSQYTSQLNESLSLTNDKLDKNRDVLLEQGKQNTYDWNYRSANKNGEPNTKLAKRENGIVVTGWYYNGDQYLLWNFRQNFINVDFKLENVWKTKESLIIEKVVEIV